jgi:hypothetical protein
VCRASSVLGQECKLTDNPWLMFCRGPRAPRTGGAVARNYLLSTLCSAWAWRMRMSVGAIGGWDTFVHIMCVVMWVAQLTRVEACRHRGCLECGMAGSAEGQYTESRSGPGTLTLIFTRDGPSIKQTLAKSCSTQSTS